MSRFTQDLSQEAKLELWSHRVNTLKITSMKDYYLSIEEDLIDLLPIVGTPQAGILQDIYLSELN